MTMQSYCVMTRKHTSRRHCVMLCNLFQPDWMIQSFNIQKTIVLLIYIINRKHDDWVWYLWYQLDTFVYAQWWFFYIEFDSDYNTTFNLFYSYSIEGQEGGGEGGWYIESRRRKNRINELVWIRKNKKRFKTTKIARVAKFWLIQ